MCAGYGNDGYLTSVEAYYLGNQSSVLHTDALNTGHYLPASFVKDNLLTVIGGYHSGGEVEQATFANIGGFQTVSDSGFETNDIDSYLTFASFYLD